MIIYFYDRSTGEHLASSEARLDPVATKRTGEDVYLIPANATTVAPPELSEHQVALWVDGAWEVHVDWRGHTYWLPDGSGGTINDLGIEPPEGALDMAPEPTLDELKADAIRETEAYATDARAQVAAYADQYKLAGWADKAQRSARVIAGNATTDDLEVLQAECDKRGLGETPEQLAALQQDKAKQLASAVAIIDGMEDSAVRAIKSKLKTNTLADLVVTLKTEADEQLNILLGGS